MVKGLEKNRTKFLKFSCQLDEKSGEFFSSICQNTIVGGGNPVLIDEHALEFFCPEHVHKPFALAQKQVIYVPSTAVKGFEIPLAFGEDHISLIKKSNTFFIHAWKPGAAYVAAVSYNRNDISQSYHAGIVHSGIIYYILSADENGNGKMWKTFLKYLDNQLVHDDLAAVISKIDKRGGNLQVV